MSNQENPLTFNEFMQRTESVAKGKEYIANTYPWLRAETKPSIKTTIKELDGLISSAKKMLNTLNRINKNQPSTLNHLKASFQIESLKHLIDGLTKAKSELETPEKIVGISFTPAQGKQRFITEKNPNNQSKKTAYSELYRDLSEQWINLGGVVKYHVNSDFFKFINEITDIEAEAIKKYFDRHKEERVNGISRGDTQYWLMAVFQDDSFRNPNLDG